MSKQELVKRYIMFFIGLLLNSFGVAFVTKASLGTSPIASIPYSLSLIFPQLTMGNWTIIFSLALIAVQPLLLKKETKWIELLLQVVISFFFGYFIDFSMMLLQGFQPSVYPVRLISLLIGCVIIALGAYFEVIADVVMLSADAFVRAIAKAIGKEYSGVRVISDISMSLISAILCLVFLHELSGVREGTVIAALITGNIVKAFVKNLKIGRKLLGETA